MRTTELYNTANLLTYHLEYTKGDDELMLAITNTMTNLNNKYVELLNEYKATREESGGTPEGDKAS